MVLNIKSPIYIYIFIDLLLLLFFFGNDTNMKDLSGFRVSSYNKVDGIYLFFFFFMKPLLLIDL